MSLLWNLPRRRVLIGSLLAVLVSGSALNRISDRGCMTETAINGGNWLCRLWRWSYQSLPVSLRF